MIDPRELRLGNLFEEIHSKEIIEVIELTNEKVVFSGDFKGKWQARPIPLSEEWLLRFGFEEHSIVFNHPKFNYTIDYSRKGGAYIDDIDLSLKFVHQLQNLYFCLTKEELKIIQ